MFTSITAPLVLAYLNSRQQRQLKIEEYARQDKVAQASAEQAALLAQNQRDAAARAERTALLLRENQQETMRRTDEVARLTAENAARTEEKLAQIHTSIATR